MCIKHEFCGLDSYEIKGKCSVFTLSFGQTDRQKDTERRTTVKQHARDV